ncbi:Lar family restriction alleviation protein [Halogeometricum sp. S1BR25-6]|uniref:Lar family restriction alleviation protein n=1 Tax=Halogeometricum salsisoli TaxID=2950536 RepID=A0ABU2GEQ4_9EURY|nr:hypothetical protein [Halogeometricum sp. S1BR25-6]MDS0299290.1 Lar family restriction alleviation protein [Halogeometricum sp. S1BR25-6]
MSLLDSIRRPDYTGERRCWPCTAVNVAVLLAAAVVLWPLSTTVALLAAVGGGALVYLRGYVVPGTPEFAPRLVARLGLSHLFEHAPDGGETRQSDELGGEDGEQVLFALFEAGVLREDEDGALYLSGEFWSAWEAEMASLRDRGDEAVAAAVAEAAPFDAEGGVDYGGITVDGERDSIWLSRAHAVGDAAAVRTMAAFDVPESVRAPATAPLRMFLESCPLCGGPVEERTTALDCCGGTMGVYDDPEDEILACADCGETLYVFEEEKAGEEDADAESDTGPDTDADAA